MAAAADDDDVIARLWLGRTPSSRPRGTGPQSVAGERQGGIAAGQSGTWGGLRKIRLQSLIPGGAPSPGYERQAGSGQGRRGTGGTPRNRRGEAGGRTDAPCQRKGGAG